MEQIWYYTLSTIAQTLAALLGLIAIFVVLRLQGLIKNVSDYRYRAFNILKVAERYLDDYFLEDPSVEWILEDLRAFVDRYSNKERINDYLILGIRDLSTKYNFDQADDIDFLYDTVGNLSEFLRERDEVIDHVKLPGMLGGLTIGISIILLSITDKVTSYMQPLLIVIVLLTIWSIAMAIWKSWKIIEPIKKLD